MTDDKLIEGQLLGDYLRKKFRSLAAKYGPETATGMLASQGFTPHEDDVAETQAAFDFNQHQLSLKQGNTLRDDARADERHYGRYVDPEEFGYSWEVWDVYDCQEPTLKFEFWMQVCIRCGMGPLIDEQEGVCSNCRLNINFNKESKAWFGRRLIGKHAHWCRESGGLPVDETSPGWPCGCKWAHALIDDEV
jgi:hypothetical protein